MGSFKSVLEEAVKPKFTVGVFGAIFHGSDILLVRPRGLNRWSLPGGGVESDDLKDAENREDELLLITLFRELWEEVGIALRDITTISPKPMPFVSVKLHDIAFLFIVEVSDEAKKLISPHSEIAEIGWFEKDHLPPLVGRRMLRMIISAYEFVGPSG